ncbi:MAG TPA: hypothetical protein VHL58_19510 [Thermoanaerobaculia bacterium]|nr:hypothetical protein [Thermoanaerobaculia bacterium]
MKRASLFGLILVLLCSGCSSWKVRPMGWKEDEVIVRDDATADKDPIPIDEGKDSILWRAGQNVSSMTIKFTDPNPPKFKCTKRTVCRLPHTATPGKGHGCKDPAGNPARECHYNYEVMIWKANGDTAGKDPVVIIKEYP